MGVDSALRDTSARKAKLTSTECMRELLLATMLKIAKVQSRSKGAPHNQTEIPFLVDDDYARALMAPILHRLLSQLDRLLMALHETMISWPKRERGKRPDPHQTARASNSQHQSSSSRGVANAPGIKRRRGRPSKVAPANSADVPMANSHFGEPGAWRAKLTNRGRPRRQYPVLAGESEQEYLIRVARLQKKPLPKFAVSEDTKQSMPEDEPLVSSKSGATASCDVEDPTFKTRGRYQLRDWSQVIGMASVVGFDGETISRTVKRCASIFNEEMDFLMLGDQHVSRHHLHTVGQHEETCRVDSSSSHQCPSHEEMHGSIHVDGFLQPIKQRSGWRGIDVGPRKPGRWHNRETSSNQPDVDEDDIDSVASERINSGHEKRGTSSTDDPEMTLDMHDDNTSSSDLDGLISNSETDSESTGIISSSESGS